LIGLLLLTLRLLYIGLIFAIASLVMVVVFGIRHGDVRNNRYFTSFVNFLLKKPLGVIFDVDTSAAIYDESPVVMVVNHQGLYDIITCGYFLPIRSAALAKLSLGYIPVWGQMFMWGGNVMVNRKSAEDRKRAMDDMRSTLLDKKASLFIFPEGTRNSNNELLDFRMGAFITAYKNKVPVQPVVISSYVQFKDLKKWKSHISCKVLPPVELHHLEKSGLDEAVANIRADMQREKDLLNEKLSR
jgi:1-acyl-sn-glycerol-3-phosphate acyltransferase